MSAILVSRMIVQDAEKLQEYSQAAGPTLAAFDAKVVAKGKFNKALLGESQSHVTGILEFPDMASIDAWFGSAEYQALTDVRDAIGEIEFIAYDAP